MVTKYSLKLCGGSRTDYNNSGDNAGINNNKFKVLLMKQPLNNWRDEH